MFENEDDAKILQAVKKRLLRELKENGGSPKSRGGHSQQNDVKGMMMEGDDPFDYLVDIKRGPHPDYPDNDKAWEKKVHRYREKKK